MAFKENKGSAHPRWIDNVPVTVIQAYIDEGHSRKEAVNKFGRAARTLLRRGVVFRGTQKKREAKLAIAKQAIANGDSQMQAAIKAGIGRGTLRANNVNSSYPQGWPRVPSEKVRRVEELKTSGMSERKATRVVGIAKNTLYMRRRKTRETGLG